jgi:uncharacterized protein (UPF0335 family)
MQHSAQQMLRQYIEQLERLEDEKKAIADDIRDKFAEAKSSGFDIKIMRKVLATRKKSKDEQDEDAALLDTYLAALGMIGTPMGDYINQQEAAA